MIDFNVLNAGNMSGAEFKGAQHGKMPDMPIEDKAPFPVKRDPFDPVPVLAIFKRFVAEIDKMDAQAMALKVKDDESNAMAVEMTTQAKRLDQTINKKHKELKTPYLAVTQPLDGLRKKLSDRLLNTQKIINNKIRPFLQEKERKRQEAQRKADEAARKEQERLDAIAKAEADNLAEEARKKAMAENKTKEEAEAAAQEAAAMVEPVPIVVAEVPEEVKVKTETGTADIKREWAWEIEDFKALPDAAYQNRCDEVTKALAPYLNAQVKAGVREIPGVKIFQTTKLSTRTRR